MTTSIDTTFVSQTTSITTAWAQNINDAIWKGRNPNYIVSTGSSTSYVITLPTGSLYTAPVVGDAFTWKAHVANSGAATLSIVGSITGGPFTLSKQGSITLSAGDIALNAIITTVYDGTNFQVINVSSSAGIPLFTQAGTGAVSRTYQNKVRETVSVLDFGAVADCTAVNTGTDNLAAFNLCTTYANANGYDVIIPPGRYRLSGSWNIDNTGQNSAYGKDFRCNIHGFGPRSSQLWFDTGSYYAIHIIGSTTGTDTGNNGWQTFRGLNLLKSDRLGTGLYYQGLSHIQTEDINIQGFNYGHIAYDVLTSNYTNFTCVGNNYGGFWKKLNWSHPNAISLYNCTFGANLNYGLLAYNTTGFNFSGGTIESNGNGGIDATKWGARFVYDSASPEGTYSATFTGTYFENNVGLNASALGCADAFIQNSSGVEGTAIFVGCSFGRFPTNYALNCIRYETSGGGKNNLTVLGCGFKGLNGYTPSAGRPYIGIPTPTDPTVVTAIGNSYSSATEIPNLSYPYVVPAAMSSAWVRFTGSSAAIAQSHNVAGVVRNGVGDYTITFNRSLAATQNCVSFGFFGAAGVGYVQAESASSLRVLTTTLAGAFTDFQVSVVVMGGMGIA